MTAASGDATRARVQVRSWSAWAPGLASREAWEAWCRGPEPLAPEGHPDARFLPAMLRRRCSPLTRVVLTAAFGCVDEGLRSGVRTVFASRHGSVNESIELLRAIVRGERISPAIFSHTVHNAQAGLYCIAAGNREGSSSVAARTDTFGCGWLEALTHLQRDPARPVLYVMGDVGLAPTFAEMVEEPSASYAVALLLAREGAEAAAQAGEAPALDFTAGDAAPAARPWPDAAEFLRWLVADDAPTLDIGRFRWSRA